MKNLIRDLKEFMMIESISGNEAEAALWLSTYLQDHDFATDKQEITKDRFNVISNLRDCKVLFCSHIDTVPPFIAPEVSETQVLGRGACDAKGVIIAQIATAIQLIDKEVIDKKDIGFAYVVGEEQDHIGAKYLEKLDFHAELAVVGEPTENILCSKGMGLLKIKFSTTGIAGHSAFPKSGRSAVHELVDVLAQVDDTVGSDDAFKMGTSLYNIGTIKGGTAANVHAPSATATVLYRLAEPSDSVIRRLEDVIQNYGPHTTYSVISRFEPIMLSSPDRFHTTVARFNSDARYLIKKSKNVILVGPGDIKVAHSNNEHIMIEDIESGIEVLQDIILTFLT